MEPLDVRRQPFLLLLLFYLLSLNSLIAQAPEHVRFKHISIEEGLPGRYALSIIQDRKGFIWIGSSYGLSRYDGYSLKNYRFDPV